MPIPNLLVGPELLAVAAGGDLAVGVEQRLRRAQNALDQLGAQRRALLSEQIPRLAAVWKRADATSALETYRETLLLLAGSDEALNAERGGHEVLPRLPPPAGGGGKHALAEAIRFEAIERAGAAGVQRLAHARIRLSAMARRIDKGAGKEAGSRPFQRVLEGSATFAAAAAAAGLQPVLARDGGVDRRFTGALRRLQI